MFTNVGLLFFVYYFFFFFWREPTLDYSSIQFRIDYGICVRDKRGFTIFICEFYKFVKFTLKESQLARSSRKRYKQGEPHCWPWGRPLMALLSTRQKLAPLQNEAVSTFLLGFFLNLSLSLCLSTCSKNLALSRR